MKPSWTALTGVLASLMFLLVAITGSAITITRMSSATFYVDSNKITDYDCNYACYEIYNNDGTNYNSVWVTLTNLTGSVVLAPYEDGQVNLGALPVGAREYAYFYLRGTSKTGTAAHDVVVYNGLPSLRNQLTSQPFTLTMAGILSASANKVTAVVTGPTPPTLGGVVTITVTGETGTVGGSQNMAITPASLSTWNPGAFELFDTYIIITNTGSFTNDMFFTLTAKANNGYMEVYKLRAVQTTTAPTDVHPNSPIDSGTQTKYTGTYQGTIQPVGTTTNGIILIQESVTCGATNAVATNLTYNLILSNTSPNEAFVDAFVVTLSGSITNATYTPNSSKTNNSQYSDPVITVLSSNSQKLTWSGYYSVPGNSTAKLTFQVDVPAVYGSYTNSSYALIGSVQIDSTLAVNDNSPATCLFTLAPLADIQVTKSGPTNVFATSNLTYTITVTNLGPSTSSNLVVIDQLPANVTFVSAIPTNGFFTNGQVRWTNFVTFTNGQSTNLTVTVTAPGNGPITNFALATASIADPSTNNNNGTSNNAIVVTAITPFADVRTSKTGPASVNAASNIVYTILVTNTGPSTATNVVVSDLLPTNTVFLSATGGGNTNTNGVVTWSITSFTNGQTTNFTLTLLAPSFATNLTNVIRSTSDTADAVVTNNDGTWTNAIVATTVIPPADVKVSKTGPTDVNATSNVVYTITVTNLGPGTASNLVVSDVLPTNIVFVSATGGGVSNNGVVTWPSFASFTNGQSTNFTLTVTAPTNGVTLTNIVLGTTTTSDLIATNNNGTGTNGIVLTTVIPPADVQVSKTGPANVNAASNITYTITVTNLGPGTASNVVVSDVLPTNIVFVSATGGGVSNNGVVVWPSMASFTNGQSTNFTLTLMAPTNATTLTNIVSGTASTADFVVTNNNGTGTNAIVLTTVIPPADVQVSKTGPAVVNASSNIVYTITVTNFGPGTASNLVVSDVLPTDTVFVSATSGGASNNGVVTWPAIASFANGQATNFTLILTAPAAVTNLTNVVLGTTTTTDLVTTNNNGSGTNGMVVTAVAAADVRTSKTGPANAVATSNVVYTITVTNLGPSTASNVVVSDVLPTNIVFVSATGGGVSNNGTVTWGSMILANGAGTNFSVTLVAPSEPGTITNVVSSTADTSDLVVTNNDGSAAFSRVLTAVSAQADLLVAKSGPATVDALDTVTYSIAVTNFGPSVASNIVVSDILPAGATFVSASAGGTNSSGTVVWPTIATLANGAATNFTLTLTAAPDGVMTNIAFSTSTTPDIVSTNNDGSAAFSRVLTTIIPRADIMTTKSGAATVMANSNLVYTITVTNLGPSIASNVVVSDMLPAGVTFVGASSGGSHSGGTVTWPAISVCSNGFLTNFTVTVTAPGSGSLTNRVSSTAATADPVASNNDGSSPAARVVTLVNALSLSGKVYADTNLNSHFDAGEVGTALALYAKLIPAATPSGPAQAVVAVDPGTGAYDFFPVTPGTYNIILDDNNNAADVTPTIPSGWTGTEAPGQIRYNIVVNNVNVINQNFGLAQVVTIKGTVFKDDAAGGGTASDGVRNGTETGIVGVTVKLTDSGGSTIYATAVTDGTGGYTLFIPNSVPNGTQLKVVELNLSSYISVSGTAGSTGGAYDRPTDTTTFNRVTGTSYTGVDFGDVPDNQFVSDNQQAGLPGTVVFYAHTFTANSAGQVSFTSVNMATPVLATWSHVLYRDSNCNGKLDSGEPALTAPITLLTGEKLCIVVKQFIPAGAPLNAQDRITVTAHFTFTNTSPALALDYNRVDLTTVGTPTTAGLTLIKEVDKTTALPGETITYTVTYSNGSTEPLNNIVVFDATPAYTTFLSASSGALAANLTAVNIAAPAVGSAGAIRWTFTGTLAPGSTGTVTFQVKIE